jgi:hypothetical protein
MQFERDAISMEFSGNVNSLDAKFATLAKFREGERATTME